MENLVPDTPKWWGYLKLKGRRTYYNVLLPEDTLGGVLLDYGDHTRFCVVTEEGRVLIEDQGSLQEIGELTPKELSDFKKKVESHGVVDPVTF